MRVTSQPPFEKTVAPVRNVTWLMTASLKTASLADLQDVRLAHGIAVLVLVKTEARTREIAAPEVVGHNAAAGRHVARETHRRLDRAAQAFCSETPSSTVWTRRD